MKRPARSLLLPFLLIPMVAAASPQADPPREEQQAGRRPLDLTGFTIRPPSPAREITGSFRFVSPFDGDEHALTIRETEAEFWRYEGTLDGRARAVLKLDPAPAPTVFRGRVEPGFDACLGEDAHVERTVVSEDRLELMVAVRSIPRPGSSRARRCGEALTFRLVSTGGGRVRLRRVDERRVDTVTGEATDSFLPSGASIDPQVEAQRQAIEAQSRGRDETVFGSGRRVPSGSRVRVAMVLTDLRGQSWYRVELLDDAGTEEDGPPSGWVKENELVGRVRLVLERSGEPPQDPP